VAVAAAAAVAGDLAAVTTGAVAIGYNETPGLKAHALIVIRVLLYLIVRSLTRLRAALSITYTQIFLCCLY
jgi:hypothetical protein